MFRSIFAKQFVLYLSALIISYIILAVALSSAFTSFFVDQKSDILTEQSRRIANVYRQNIFGELLYDRLRLENEISVLHEYLDSSFLFVGDDRVIKMATSDIAATIDTKFEMAEFSTVFEDGETVRHISTLAGIFPEKVLTVGFPVTMDCPVAGAVFLSSSMPELERSASEMYRVTLICLGVSGVIAFVLVFFLSRSISRPLREMNNAAKVIAGGDFEKRIEAQSRDEVGQLAQSFNNMAESLFEQEKLRRIFIANISHDLRSPLTSMRGFLQAIIDGLIPNEKVPHYLGIVMDETQRLSSLTHDIIDVNKIQSQEVVLEKSVFDLNALLRQTLNTFEPRIKEKSIAATLNLENEKTLVLADHEKISRVIYNLVDNAVKFTGENGAITVETTVKDKKVHVSVRDNGRGIGAKDQKHVFDRFYKADASRGEDKTGSGLGLSIVQAFIKAHDEQVSLVSEEGAGSEFVFTLPIVKEKD